MWLLLSLIVFTCAREPSSPICSRYDYEERLLERVLRNELALETTLNDILKTNAKVIDALKLLEDGKEKVESTLADMEKKQIDIESRLAGFISDSTHVMKSTLDATVVALVETSSEIKENASVTKQQLVYEVRVLKDQLKVPTINFRARITTYSTDVSSGLDVIFHTVEENVGQGYDPASGKFTASVPGMYLFSVQYCVYTKKNVHLEIVHQGKTLQRSANYDNASDYPCVTMQVSTVVAMGHQVWVRSTGSSTLYADSQRYTSFSGTLIHV
ncbi:uncharacterized protein LOC127834603 isoform X3 [Dreissena polymorpha]|uniref:uncharacterized protein LOC127834603 isoform X3 n=1 Tax=Dreissena polymorpha TaxID=45954 RepID=UPI002264C88F|nr:uncharacterized protein LOC127834603 isoform X3 [Dreissena polymorpha]